MGLLRTVARGARRPKSTFRGLLDLFFEAEIAVVLSKKTNLHTLREVKVLQPFSGIRQSYRRTQTAAYFVELIEACTEAEHHEPDIFDLLQRAFGYLNTHEPRRISVLHFEAELARIAGVQNAERIQAARALGALFGKLPLSRTPLLKTLGE